MKPLIPLGLRCKMIGAMALMALTSACVAPSQPQTQQIQQVIVVVTATPQAQAAQNASVVEATPLPTAQIIPAQPQPTVVPATVAVPTAMPLPSATPDGGSVDVPAPTEVPPTAVPPEAPTEVPTEVPPVVPTHTPMVIKPLPTLIAPLVKFSAGDQSLIKSQCTTLTWKATLMKSVEINGVNKPLQGSEQICPSDTTNYTLVATTKAGKQIVKSIEVKVIPLVLTKIVVPVKPIKPVLPKP